LKKFLTKNNFYRKEGEIMKFETKAIHGEKKDKSKQIDWSNTISMASAYPTREFGVEEKFHKGRVSNPQEKNLKKR